ncbi:MAG: VacJ family lipoprotein [Rubellimicrobium sp.]|nr:VacJ family lipoprotein [Rubellimicrobium sp.]
MSRVRNGIAATIAALTLLGACSVAPPGTDIHDPYEDVNRQIHAFNRELDRNVLRPLGQVTAEMPPEITQRVVSFSDNAALPGMVLNGVLQGDIEIAATNAMRFLINSTVGVVGLFDPAGVIGLGEIKTDFGMTLARWGVPEGAFVELPFFGPSTERDAIGRVVNAIIDPLDQVGFPVQSAYERPAWVAEQVIERGSFGSTVDSILYESADSYAQTRLIYLQNRRFRVGQRASDDNLQDDETIFFDVYEAIR